MKSNVYLKPFIVIENNSIIRFPFKNPITDPYILKRIELLTKRTKILNKLN